MNLATLRSLGFDNSEHVPFTKEYRLRCSQCQALAINGVPTHETGCRNQKGECSGCDTIVERGVRYCKDCM